MDHNSITVPVLGDDWTPVSQEPQEYGPYIIVQPGGTTSYQAYYGHPYGERETGWYAGGSGGRIIRPLYWRKFPAIPSALLAKGQATATHCSDDTVRIDWLEAQDHIHALQWQSGGRGTPIKTSLYDRNRVSLGEGISLRKAIDAAMQTQEAT
jgi:hypothetical protein